MLWGIDYRQQWSAGELPTLDSLLALGAGPLLASRLEGLAAALGSFALLPLAAVLVPLALIGAWQRRRDPAFAPFFMYGALLLAVSSVLFAGHVAHGMFMHSAVALVPHTFLLVGVGLGGAIDWMAARRPAWQPQRARSVFGGGLVAVALVAALVQGQATLAAWRAAEQPRRELAAALAELPSTDVLMAADPGALNYLYGRPAIVTPDDPLPLIERAARLYGVRWLVLEQAQIVPSLVPVLRGELHPGWLSAPLAVVPAHQPALAAAGAVDASSEPPLAALYAVCLEPADTRCVR
jgi:hypothetical protein